MKEEDQLLLNQDIDLNFVLILRKIQHREDKFSLTKNGVCPGENVEAEITMLSPQLFENKLYEGLEFKFCEGRTIVGYGTILNEKLIRK